MFRRELGGGSVRIVLETAAGFGGIGKVRAIGGPAGMFDGRTIELDEMLEGGVTGVTETVEGREGMGKVWARRGPLGIARRGGATVGCATGLKLRFGVPICAVFKAASKRRSMLSISLVVNESPVTFETVRLRAPADPWDWPMTGMLILELRWVVGVKLRLRIWPVVVVVLEVMSTPVEAPTELIGIVRAIGRS